MNKVLQEIIKNTIKEVSKRKHFYAYTPRVSTRNERRSFKQSILNPKHTDVALIAEIKLASPIEKNLGSPDGILEKAVEYERAGSDAISFITEKSVFKGDIKFIPRIKSKVKLPILQKDFVIDPYQIYEAKINGSDALLLIAKILPQEKLTGFVNICLEIGLEPVVEVNDEEDLRKALKTQTLIIAVNARNLDTLKVNFDAAIKLLNKIPKGFLKMGFSGINSKAEVERYIGAGAKAVLVGTNLMKAGNTKEFLKGLR